MNLKKFTATKHSDRTAAIPCPELAEFFTPGETPELIVRGLTAEESMICNEAPKRDEQTAALAEALAAGNKEAAAEVTKALGISGKQAPAQYSRFLSLVIIGSVAPKFDRPAAIHLAKNYPNLFMLAAMKVLELTGLNRVPGKLPGSGETIESASL